MATGIAQASVHRPQQLFQLNDGPSDSRGGATLNTHGGSFADGHYHFGVNQGLSLQLAQPLASYTIDMRFALDQTSSYARLLDFKSGASDRGLYAYQDALTFYRAGASLMGTTALQAQQMQRLQLSRDDASKEVRAYLDGVLQFRFQDLAGDALFQAGAGRSTQARFFIDDGSTEASRGRVDYIAVYDRALRPAELGDISSPVPEPKSYALLLAGLGVMVFVARRSRAR
ncbi:PEP-CTERM sorting domain-containing protein [Paucibacter sp. XJ19-41]|uniref:PEP-CTERM sorting domain-containing protein n=1 Tax=Paucibacter sp. XJ19-41 TaxID=2927824 RepID=UPI0023498FA7|nr:PEP-CTERM sorting domain-containing protein [Paucibacter sp. XJ19-41]MDC6169856.1 PEP-CTERM sorting domain-containing protein [Paucibacter sp. XJ19-41]